MAVKTLTPVKGNVNEIQDLSWESATTASDGVEFTMPKTTDEYVVLMAYNSSSDTAYDVTVKAPASGSYAAATSDKVKTGLAAGKIAFFRIESARYASNVGKVKAVGSNAAIKFAVIY